MDGIQLSLLFIRRLFRVETHQIPLPLADMTPFCGDHLYPNDPYLYRPSYLVDVFNSLAEQEYAHIQDPLNICLSVLRVEDQLCLVGPYMQPHRPDPSGEVLMSAGIGAELLSSYRMYMNNLSALEPADLTNAFQVLLESIFGNDIRCIERHIDLSKTNTQYMEEVLKPAISSNQEHYVSNVSMRYEVESLFMVAVSNGRVSHALSYLDRIDELVKVEGYYDASSLNAAILGSQILLTLVRISAVRANVDPFEIDTLSMTYSRQLRRIRNLSSITPIRVRMVIDFCNLIRKKNQLPMSPKVRQAAQYIVNNLASPLSVESVAKEIHISPNYLSTCFKRDTGISVPQFIRHHRLNVAVDLLTNTNMSIRDISTTVGFSTLSYFTKLFREEKGMPPSEYRKQPGSAISHTSTPEEEDNAQDT